MNIQSEAHRRDPYPILGPGKEWFANTAEYQAQVHQADYERELFIAGATYEQERSKVLPNCLSYALRFWSLNKDFLIYYGSGHVFNSMSHVRADGVLPIEYYGEDYFKSSFNGLLDDKEWILLSEYFNHKYFDISKNY
jgi:hypothetical protein